MRPCEDATLRFSSSMYLLRRCTKNPTCRGSPLAPCVTTQHFSMAATKATGSLEMTGIACGMNRRELILD